MSGFRSFFIEFFFLFFFHLVIEERGCYFLLWIFERGKYFMKSIFMGKNVTQWLMKNVEHIVIRISSKQFFTIRDGDVAYTLHRSANSFGHFLLLTELKVIIINWIV